MQTRIALVLGTLHEAHMRTMRSEATRRGLRTAPSHRMYGLCFGMYGSAADPEAASCLPGDRRSRS
jgi:hypothetical protein